MVIGLKKFILKIILYGLMITVVAVIQASVMADWKIYGVMADITVPFTVIMAMRHGYKAGMATGIYLGMLVDAQISTMGFNIFILGFLGLVAGYIIDLLFRRNFASYILFIGVGITLKSLLSWMILYAMWNDVSMTVFMSKVLPEIIYTYIVGIALYGTWNLVRSFYKLKNEVL